jgi:hypothetical protein
MYGRLLTPKECKTRRDRTESTEKRGDGYLDIIAWGHEREGGIRPGISYQQQLKAMVFGGEIANPGQSPMMLYSRRETP